MELTPEERQRIYLEEKARMERETMEPESSTDAAPERHQRSILPMVFTLGIILALTLGASAVIKKMGPPVKSDPAEDRAALESDLQSSMVVQRLRAARVISSFSAWDTGVSVTVGSGFYRLDYEDKLSAMRAISQVIGPRRGGNHFLLYDYQTNKKIGAWRGQDGLEIF